jgi:S-adenosylmethionine hydrolase
MQGVPLTATIALLTDFGSQDAYVGVIKGVIARITPQAHVIDITHSIPPGDVRRAAFELFHALPYFPSRTVFVTVVDPGVGTVRRPIALSLAEMTCVGPDNGVFSYILASMKPRKIVELESSTYHLHPVSHTFHGRDIFAPVAAHLAAGVDLDVLGPVVQDLIQLHLPKLTLIEGPIVQGEIMHADRFGNLITSLGALRLEGDDVILEPWLPYCPPARLPSAGLRVRLPNGVFLRLSNTFSDAPVGEAVAYIGSKGLLEVGINQARAIDVFPFSTGQEIILSYKG